MQSKDMQGDMDLNKFRESMATPRSAGKHGFKHV